MVRREKCPSCGALCEYDDRSVWEGNREREEFKCPECGYVLDIVFTDQLPHVRVIEKETKKQNKESLGNE